MISAQIRRTFQWATAALAGTMPVLEAAEPSTPVPTKNVAAIVTEYRHNSHAEIIAGRLLRTDTLDDKGNRSPLKLVSLYTDQRPNNDLSRGLAAKYGFRTSPTIEDALTLR